MRVRKRPWGQRGAAAIFLLLMFVVTLAFMSMAIDVGRLYLVQAELQTAADAGALAAATRLIGTATSPDHAADQFTSAFDTTGGNDNRFNLRQSLIGVPGSELATELRLDFFTTLEDARLNSNGGQSGATAKYVRVEVRAEAPVWFTRFLSPDREPLQSVATAAVAGLGAPLCGVCGIDALAVVAIDPSDTDNFGFALDGNYTLYFNPQQQFPGLPGCLGGQPAPLLDTIASVQYVVLNHVSGATGASTEEELFRLGGAGMSSRADLDPPGCVLIQAQEALLENTDLPVCAVAGRDLLCGLNTRFGVDFSTNNCAAVPGIDVLAPFFSSDSDAGAAALLQEYSQDYDGNTRRVLTAAIIDAPDTRTVLGFRQFFLQNGATLEGLGPIAGATAARAAFRAQFIGTPVPARTGTAAGVCQLTTGVGRTVLH